MKRDLNTRVCIIGAGPSGITAAKNLLQVGLKNFVVYEKNDQVGGNWIFSPRLSHSSVFETTHIISSKTLSEYLDYPFPADYPDYPSHKQILTYFQGYAEHFGVIPYIQFNTEVLKVEPTADQQWQVSLKDGRVETFDHVLVANGHHWNPRMPDYEGQFAGEFLHSHDYKTAAPFADKRVLVIGGGNSSCDIAVETSRISAFTAVSWRRGYYILPKFLMGQPADVMNSHLEWLPRRVRAPIFRLGLRLVVGRYSWYGLPEPEDPLYAVHPVANSELLYFIRHGKIHPRRDIDHFEGKTVFFKDGLQEDYDVIIAATGFYITFPFFDTQLIDFCDKDVPLYLRVFHPQHLNLYFIGLVQPMGCIWPLSDAQSKLVANYIVGNYNIPHDIEARIQRDVSQIRQSFISSPRHTIEVHYHDYLHKLLNELPPSAPKWG